jgi:hypothetical protein
MIAAIFSQSVLSTARAVVVVLIPVLCISPSALTGKAQTQLIKKL